MAKYEESTEQIKFVQRVRMILPEILIHSIPNGGKLTGMQRIRREKEGELAGVSDLFIAEPIGKHCGLYIEMKRKTGGKVSKKQNAFMLKAEAKGYRCHVANSCELAWGILNEYLNGDYSGASND